MIYCVVPRALESELYDKLVEHYRDNPNVTVIVDRREGPERRAPGSVRRPGGERDRRRRRATGSFPSIDAPAAE